MELVKNEFRCIECSGKGFADSVEAILKRNKLCAKCFCASLGLEEEVVIEYNPNFKKKQESIAKKKDIVTKELNTHNSLKREPAKKRLKKHKDRRW